MGMVNYLFHRLISSRTYPLFPHRFCHYANELFPEIKSVHVLEKIDNDTRIEHLLEHLH